MWSGCGGGPGSDPSRPTKIKMGAGGVGSSPPKKWWWRDQRAGEVVQGHRKRRTPTGQKQQERQRQRQRPGEGGREEAARTRPRPRGSAGNAGSSERLRRAGAAEIRDERSRRKGARP